MRYNLLKLKNLFTARRVNPKTEIQVAKVLHNSAFASKCASRNDGSLRLVTTIGDIKISTVHLKIYCDDLPYETMIFGQGESWPITDCWRWETEEEARRGHEYVAQMVELFHNQKAVCKYCDTQQQNKNDVVCPRCGGAY